MRYLLQFHYGVGQYVAEEGPYGTFNKRQLHTWMKRNNFHQSSSDIWVLKTGAYFYYNNKKYLANQIKISVIEIISERI